jgi:hypothetical protein
MLHEDYVCTFNESAWAHFPVASVTRHHVDDMVSFVSEVAASNKAKGKATTGPCSQYHNVYVAVFSFHDLVLHPAVLPW